MVKMRFGILKEVNLRKVRSGAYKFILTPSCTLFAEAQPNVQSALPSPIENLSWLVCTLRPGISSCKFPMSVRRGKMETRAPQKESTATGRSRSGKLARYGAAWGPRGNNFLDVSLTLLAATSGNVARHPVQIDLLLRLPTPLPLHKKLFEVLMKSSRFEKNLPRDCLCRDDATFMGDETAMRNPPVVVSRKWPGGYPSPAVRC